jgi:murein DD-endopeptidase MepM/ murein hydrolase activator NlpD
MASSSHHRSSVLVGRLLVASLVWLVTLSLLLVLAPRGAAARATVAGSTAETTARAGGGGWAWPLAPQPRVLRHFEPPTTRYGPGHRGIDLAALPGQPVVAVAAGVVTHSGPVAGRGTVTVLHPSGVSSTYEPVEDRIGEGTSVTAGAQLGAVGVGAHCTAVRCLHLGARLGEEYLDPLLLLARARIVLLPLLDTPT